MSKNSEHHDTYIIPPNFIEGSTLFGGMFKIRNVIEAGVLAAAVCSAGFLSCPFTHRPYYFFA